MEENTMGKLYTIDHKLLTETPELRILDQVYPVDDRVNTVEKVQSLMEQDGLSQSEMMDQVLALALGNKAAKEIKTANYPFPGYMSIFKSVVAAMLGEDESTVEERFQNAKAVQE